MDMNKLKGQSNERYRQAFLLGLAVAAVMFLPFVIYDRGYFFFFGDFNVQQIPFYKLAHEAVRSGAIYWNEFTDLGANFIGSYSFYLLGSPFFWLTLPFPTAWVPYMMAPLLCLKFGVITLTGYGFITRFVKNKDYALMGAILYAFSGFSIYNVFFNHFHEAIAFFPLLLISMEEHLQNNRRGFFALSVFICALSNYFFFAGQVVFVFIYFFIRTLGGHYRLTVSKFLTLALEAVLGVALSAVLLLPSVLAVMDNPRVDDFLSGWNALFYNNVQRYGAILQTFFFPPDLPSRPNFFPDGNVKWASVAGWLPLAGMCGVIAFIQKNRGHFVKRMILTSLVFALVPVLNSSFFMFNGSYYARWFYMPILFLALATVMAFEDPETDIQSGIRQSAFVTGAIAVAIGLMPVKKDDTYTIGLEEYPERYWVFVGVAVLCLILMAVLFRGFARNKKLPRYALITACVISCAYGMMFIGLGKSHSYSTSYIIDTALEARDKFDLPETENQFYRVDVYEGMDNQAMFWHMPSIQAFHSIVPVSVMDFYPEVGVERAVGSRPETKYYALRSLLSVRWLFVNEDSDREFGMPGYEYYGTQNGYEIYENKNYIPMAFVYDSYADEMQFDSVSKLLRGNLLVHSVYLDWETADRNMDILRPTEDLEVDNLNETQFQADCAARRARSAHYFAFDSTGFSAGIKLEKESFVFFSVPYEKGFSAYINGKPALIEKANIGFMALRVPAGENVIRFEYNTPGLYEGMFISLGALLVLGLYLLTYYLIRRRRGPEPPPEEQAPSAGQTSLYFEDEAPNLSVEPLDGTYRLEGAKAQGASPGLRTRRHENLSAVSRFGRPPAEPQAGILPPGGIAPPEGFVPPPGARPPVGFYPQAGFTPSPRIPSDSDAPPTGRGGFRAGVPADTVLDDLDAPPRGRVPLSPEMPKLRDQRGVEPPPPQVDAASDPDAPPIGRTPSASEPTPSDRTAPKESRPSRTFGQVPEGGEPDQSQRDGGFYPASGSAEEQPLKNRLKRMLSSDEQFIIGINEKKEGDNQEE